MSAEDLGALGALQDPVRRALYEYVSAQGREVSRGEAAEAAGIQRTLAAFHLDRLVEAGLLEVGSRRLTGRSGPGSGRPAKVYRRASAEHQVSVPPRDYRMLALLLAEAVELLGAEEPAETAARRAGERLGAAEPPGADLTAVLTDRGYEPYPGEDGEIRLRNCPFHVAAERHPVLVCSVNLALCQGLLKGLGRDGSVAATMDPRPGECCVAFAEAPPGGGAASSKYNED
ncbi:helix-turn-helix domain-containing protein [Thermopolyspora sp. NPDC052614]|uniref:helix-turn-helix transcriptional regulator n=1 Tax=Thermopolyspora sp. NPDC052614 TaxID=3155682 RepID=UPI003418DB41